MANRDSNGRNCARTSSQIRPVARVTTKTCRRSGCSAAASAIVPLKFGSSDHSGGVRDPAGPGAVREKDDRRAGKQHVSILVDEIEGSVAHRDHDVEPVVLVFQAKGIAKRGLVLGVREPRLVDVFRVVVDAGRKTFPEYSLQLTIADDDDLRVSPGRVQDEHSLLLVPEPTHVSPGRRATSVVAINSHRRNRPRVNDLRMAASEVDLGRDLHEPWRQDCRRLQPRTARNERCVI